MPKISLFLFNLILSLWLASLPNIIFYQQLTNLTSFQGGLTFVFIFITYLILTSFYCCILQLLSWRITAKPIALFLTVLAGFTSYFTNQLGIKLDTAQVQNLIQTDLHETLDLLSLPLFLHILGYVIVPSVVFLALPLRIEALKKKLQHKVLSVVVMFAIMGVGLFVFYGQYAPIFLEHRELKSQISPLNILSSATSYITKHIQHAHQPLVRYGTDATHKPSHDKKVFVIVVGETGRAESWHLDGYNRPTNPNLEKLDIINFSQATSCGTQTAVSVPCMFSGMPRKEYDENLASHREGLLDIAQRAGYEITWIDNNAGCKGVCDRIKSYISPKDDPKYQKWCQDGECYDGILLDALHDVLKNLDVKKLQKDQLIILHQMGSHGPSYYKRYPKEFEQFKPVCATNNIQNCSYQNLIHTYDNTILYTDYILVQTIDQLKALSVPTGLFYVSDHGESTGEHGLYLHGTPYFIAPSQQTHVPMLMWFSPQWRDETKFKACLQSQQATPVSQDNLFPTVLGLLQIKTQVLNPSLNLLERCK